MRQTQNKNTFRATNRYCSTTFIFFLFLLGSTLQLDQCSDPKATFYDGYLDTFIYYASFNRDQGSYLKFRNPFQGTSNNLTQGSVMFWAKLPMLTDNALYQRGKFFECTDSIAARIDNNTIRVNFTSNVTGTTGALTTALNKQSFDIPIFQNNTDQLLQWNHYAFSFRDKKLRIHLNGAQIAEFTLNYTNMNTYGDYCVLGNALDLKQDPFNGYMRHFTFSREGFNASQDLSTKMRSVVLPNDTNVLAYFKFQKDFNYQETYYYNATRNFSQSNVAIQYSSEPEFVCYCTASYPAFLKVTKDYRLRSLDLSPSNTVLDQNGVTFSFWIYPIRLENGDNDTAIIQIQNYTDIVLANKSQTIRIDLYNSSNVVQQRVNLTKSRFRFQFWTLYSIQISSNLVTLYVDGVLIDQQSHSVALKNVSAPVLNLTRLGISMQALVYRIELYQNLQSQPTLGNLNLSGNYQASLNLDTSMYKMIVGFQTTKDFMTYNTSATAAQLQSTLSSGFFTSYNSNGLQLSANTSTNVTTNFMFEQNNDFCVNQTNTTVASLFDGLSCKSSFRYSASFNYNDQIKSSSNVTGQVRSANQVNMTIDLWFKPNLTLFNNQTRSVLFSNYELDSKNNSIPLIQIYMTQNNSMTNITCDPRYQSGKDVTIQNSMQFQLNQWLHLSCISSPLNMTLVLYNQNSNNSESQITTGTFVNFTNSTHLTYVGNTQQLNAPFYGFIREVRVFKTAFSIDQMRFVRYIKTPKLWIDTIIVNQFSFSEGYQTIQFNSQMGTDLNVTASRSLYQLAVNGLQVSPTWTQDTDLVVCPQNTVFDGQCCGAFQNLTPSISYVETTDFVALTIDLGSQQYNQVSNYNWTLLRTNSSNNNDGNNIKNKATIDSLVGLSRSLQTIWIPIAQVFLNSSYTFQVQIKTPYSTKNFTARYELVLPCPRAALLNKTSPIITQWGYETKIYLLASTQMSCYNISTLKATLLWTHNITNSSANNSMINIWTQSVDGYSITFNNEKNIPNNTIVQVNQSVAFSNGKLFNQTRIVQFLRSGVNLVLATANPYLPYQSDLVIDASQSQLLVNTANRSEISYFVKCPSAIVRNTSTDCTFNQSTGKLTIPWRNLIIPMPYQDYIFNVSFGKNNSVLMASQQVTIKWYNPQNDSIKCPSVYLPANFSLQRADLKTFTYQPSLYLDCMSSSSLTAYTFSKLYYSFNSTRLSLYPTIYNQTLNITTFNDTFELLNNSFAFKFKNDTVISRIKFGDIIPINIVMEYVNPLTNAKINDTQNMDILITFADLVVVSNITYTYVPFEQELVINASRSYDPDFNISNTTSNTSMLTYQYNCNGVPCALASSQMSKGLLNITLLDRIRLGYFYNTDYTFEVAVSNPLTPRKSSKSAIYPVRFSPPTNGTHSCPRIFMYNESTSNSSRVTQYTFNTVNATDYTVKIGNESCSTLAVSFNMILLDVGQSTLTDNGLS